MQRRMVGRGEGEYFSSLIDPGELCQGELGDLALVGRVQVEELAPGVCQAAGFCHALAEAGFVPGVGPVNTFSVHLRQARS